MSILCIKILEENSYDVNRCLPTAPILEVARASVNDIVILHPWTFSFIIRARSRYTSDEEVERQEVETRSGREEVVRVSKWHVSVDCGQYRRRTSEGRPTFFPSEHRQIDIYPRGGFAFSCCTSLDRRVTDTPRRAVSWNGNLAAFSASSEEFSRPSARNLHQVP